MAAATMGESGEAVDIELEGRGSLAFGNSMDEEGAPEGMESLPLSEVQHIMLQPDFLSCADDLRQHFDDRWVSSPMREWITTP